MGGCCERVPAVAQAHHLITKECILGLQTSVASARKLGRRCTGMLALTWSHCRETADVDVQDALTSMRQNRTTVIVAHRLSTIMDVDVIVVMKARFAPPHDLIFLCP